MANKYAEKFNRRMPVYRKYPDIFAKEICNFDCDEWQTEGLRDLASSPRVSIKSGQGVGKTGIEAIAVLWFLSCFKSCMYSTYTTAVKRCFVVGNIKMVKQKSDFAIYVEMDKDIRLCR